MKKPSLIKLLFIYQANGPLPEQVDLANCSIPYKGEDPKRELITGVYGTISKQRALEAVARWNVEHQTAENTQGRRKMPAKLLMIDAVYAAAHIEDARQMMTADMLEQSTWLNLERLATTLREEMKVNWLRWIAKDYGERAAAAVASDDLINIALEYPHYVSKLFKQHEALMGVVHPIRPLIDTKTVLMAATVRFQPERFAEAQTRFLGSITVNIV